MESASKRPLVTTMTAPGAIPAPATIRTSVDVPIAGALGEFITFTGLVDGEEHLAIGLGAWRGQTSPLVRMHSECLTGDVFGSQKCDCGKQLEEAVQKLTESGGILLYLRQEGRGMGLYNKLEAYRLQAQGHDTYAANRLLNFPEDMRNYAAAAQMLKGLGIHSIALLSNNPDKAQQLQHHGIDVTHAVPTGVFRNRHNSAYLQAKVQMTAHTIRLDD